MTSVVQTYLKWGLAYAGLLALLIFVAIMFQPKSVVKPAPVSPKKERKSTPMIKERYDVIYKEQVA